MSARLTLSLLAALAACATGRIAHAADTTSPSAPSTDAQIAESGNPHSVDHPGRPMSPH
jgi:hypothetical protein